MKPGPKRRFNDKRHRQNREAQQRYRDSLKDAKEAPDEFGETYDQRLKDVVERQRREARKVWEEENQEHLRQYNQQHYRDHKPVHQARCKTYYRKNRAAILAAKKLKLSFDRKGNRKKDGDYYHANREHILNQRRERDGVMTALPILYTAPMVNAIIDDRKGETRRIMNPQPLTTMSIEHVEGRDWRSVDGEEHFRCPYGKPGDHLWVREPLRKDDQDTVQYVADGRTAKRLGMPVRWQWKFKGLGARYCPRWASRLTLEVMEVRVERVQDIDSAGVLAEGVRYPVTPEGNPVFEVTGKYGAHNYMPPKITRRFTESELLRAHFASLWDTINADRGFTWESNPLVWVVQFKKECESG